MTGGSRAQQLSDTPQVKAEKQPSDRLEAQTRANNPPDVTNPKSSLIKQVFAKDSDAEGGPNLQDANNHGSEFWPSIWGYRIKVTDSLLVLFTFLLWIATRRLVVEADEASLRELRAYVSAQIGSFGRISPSENILVGIFVLNGGKTPAYSCRFSGDIFFADHPLPVDFRFPRIPTPMAPTTLFANVPMGGNVIATNRFTQTQIVEALQAPAVGGRRLYVFGRVDYRDAFGRNRWTKFCYSFNGYHEMIPLAQNGDWEGVRQGFSTPGVFLSFDAATAHNETDDG